jgi:hypothetical protein
MRLWVVDVKNIMGEYIENLPSICDDRTERSSSPCISPIVRCKASVTSWFAFIRASSLCCGIGNSGGKNECWRTWLSRQGLFFLKLRTTSRVLLGVIYSEHRWPVWRQEGRPGRPCVDFGLRISIPQAEVTTNKPHLASDNVNSSTVCINAFRSPSPFWSPTNTSRA